MGETLIDTSIALLRWSLEHQPAIERSRAAFDARSAAVAG